MNKALKIICLVILILSSPAWSQTGKIAGNVYNGSADSAAISNIEVRLLISRGHNIVDDSSYSQKTDTRGNFQFESLETDSSLIYYPRASFNSIVYYGSAVQLSDESPERKSNVVVYDTTSSANEIFFQLEHLFIDAEPGKMKVREIFIMNNMGDKTYIGKNFNNPNKHYVIKFPLPADFNDVEILTPDAQNWVKLDGQTLYHTELMSPGSRQFSFQYSVPIKKKEWQLNRPTFYPIGSVNIFVSNPQLVIEGPGLQAMGDFGIRGTNYQRFSVQNLMPGMELALSVKNLPGKSISFQWIVLIAVVIALLIGFGYTFKKSRS